MQSHLRSDHGLRPIAARQGGAVIVVVLVLMAMLAFLGLFFYEFVQIESNSARNYVQTGDDLFDREQVMSVGLGQVVSHTPQAYEQHSALAGGKYSLLAHVVGTIKNNGVPKEYEYRNGGGILFNPTTNRFVYSGDLTHTERVGVFNRSGAANGGTVFSDANYEFEPDVDHTYPGINSLFLAYHSVETEDANGNGVLDPSEDKNGDSMFTPNDPLEDPNNNGVFDPATEDSNGNGVFDVVGEDRNGNNIIDRRVVIKPSFFLPGLYSQLKTSPISPVTPTEAATWYTHTDLPKLMLRPHSGHMAVGSQRRFTTDFPKLSGAAALNMGVWTDTATWAIDGDKYSGLDADADGDGIKDSIYLDLGHPPIEIADGRKVIPMYFWKIEDANGLIDLNSAGNLADVIERARTDAVNRGTHIYGANRSIHFSNYGFSRAEVSLRAALSAVPTATTPLDWNKIFYRNDGSAITAFNPLQLQNTESAMLLFGNLASLDANPIMSIAGPSLLDNVEGRYGDRDRIGTNAAPTAGTDYVSAPGQIKTDDNQELYLINSAWVDRLGIGGIATDAAGRPATAGTSFQFPQPGAAFVASATDDPNEMDRYDPAPAAVYDNPFGVGEMASLHLKDSDWSRVGGFSRVRNLAPINFHFSPDAADIRSRFTTLSWNRREFGFPYDNRRSWEFNDNEGEYIGTTPAGQTDEEDNSGDLRFPPKFGASGTFHTSRHEDALSAVTRVDPRDPFRPEVRRLLTTFYRTAAATETARIRFEDLRKKFPQLPLELNRILSDDELIKNGGPGTTVINAVGNPKFRRLVDHDLTFTGAVDSVLPDDWTNTSTSRSTDPLSATGAAKEWWARFDRQRAARDIYVLLLTVAYPSDPTGAGGALDAVRAREMAQFAVNYVDAMDTDDVITAFHYDIDFSDGWNPTNDPTLTVYGVEKQTLVFSEGLWIRQNQSGSDHSTTYHDESDGEHEFLFVELRNLSPNPVNLAVDTWRIVRTDIGTGNIEFKSATLQVGTGNFVISSHDGTVKTGNNDPALSDIYVNWETTNADLEPLIPYGTSMTPLMDNNVNPVPPQACHLDLCNEDGMAGYGPHVTITPVGVTMTETKLLEVGSAKVGAGPMVLELQRRQRLGSNLTDWVTVDKIELEMRALTATTDTAVAAEFATLTSRERNHPLDAQKINDAISGVGAKHSFAPASEASAVFNTVSNTAAVQSVWQPHFDRDLASVYELLAIPVVGPAELTNSIRDAKFAPAETGKVTGWKNSTTDVPFAALGRFVPTMSMNADASTRVPWSRLLTFLKLPDETDPRTVPTAYALTKTYGQINLNSIRHPTVLAGLVDDPWTYITNGRLASYGDDLWARYLRRRDGNEVGPGGNAARALEGFGIHSDDGTVFNLAVDRTLLGRTSTDVTQPASSTNVFDARYPNDPVSVDGATPGTTVTSELVDIHTRGRYLRKVGNNATTRSHVFYAWGGYDLFDAKGPVTEAGVEAYQVGAQAADLASSRWFFVIDMTRLEEAYDSTSKTFDWRKFVIYRQRLE